ncbi:MAG: magnesium chelatase [Candidatus Bathyarchaeota archaeon B24]|nr:MAG: magnesium chelatase [Candidatus Bathyarchaeota archaeon B24]
MPISTLEDKRVPFPFTAFVDQDDLKLALLLNAVNPSIGGVLIKGEKGSGKSTIVRALADLLPEIKVSEGCMFNCNPDNPAEMCENCFRRWKKGELKVAYRRMRVITVPLGITEDRLLGTLDIEKALREGVKAFQPGLLAEANRNILYIDEVNLLPDHIVDDILDAAASGWNIVERETISIAHPSRFLLIGTMNPEEGELRPQLLDRFPLSVTVTSVKDEKLRMEIVKRNLEFEEDPEGFRERYRPKQEELRRRIIEARRLLPKVKVPDAVIQLTVRLCISLEVDGHRPDIIILKAAKTLAAFEGKTVVEAPDVKKVAPLVLSHRTRRGGFREPATPEEIYKAFDSIYNELYWDIVKEITGLTAGEKRPIPSHPVEPMGVRDSSIREPRKDSESSRETKKVERQRFFRPTSRPLKDGVRAPSVKSMGVGIRSEKLRSKVSRLMTLIKERPFRERKAVFREYEHTEGGEVKPVAIPIPGSMRRFRRGHYLSGRRAKTLTYTTTGRYMGYEDFRRGSSLNVALVPTIQTAIVRGRRSNGEVTVEVRPDDLKVKRLSSRSALTIIFLLDLSESMADYLTVVAKAIMSLHRDAYAKRDKVGVVTFKGFNAEVVSHPVRNLLVVARKVRHLKAGGYTPLPKGLMCCLEMVKMEKRRSRDVLPLIILISDGAANVPLSSTFVSPFYLDSIRRAYEDTISLAKSAARMKVPIVAIAPMSFFQRSLDRLGVRLLRTVAGITGGAFYVVSMPKPKGLVELVKKNLLPHYTSDEEVEVLIKTVRDVVNRFRQTTTLEQIVV